MKKSYEKKLRGQKGITLIALVVTIVVLLILAGVTIVTLTGENGILTQAGKAKETTEIGEEKEKIEMAATSARINGKGIITTENLKEALKVEFDNEILSITVLGENGPWKYVGKSIYFIYSNGKVKEKESYLDLNVGDYVSYPVYYDNLESYYKGEYSGWRILSIDLEDNIIALVTAGVPLSYQQTWGESLKCIKDITVSFFDNTTKYCSYGFKTSKEGEKIKNNLELKNIFMNKYTSKYGIGETIIYTDSKLGEVKNTITENTPKVQSLSVEKYWELKQKVPDLFAVPCVDENSYAHYWFANSFYDNGLQYILNDGMLNHYGHIGNLTKGIRPVVILEYNLTFSKDLKNSTDNKVVWNIEI